MRCILRQLGCATTKCCLRPQVVVEYDGPGWHVLMLRVVMGLRVIVNSAYAINTLIINNDDFIGRQSWYLQSYLAI
jgi:hypothetical protein